MISSQFLFTVLRKDELNCLWLGLTFKNMEKIDWQQFFPAKLTCHITSKKIVLFLWIPKRMETLNSYACALQLDFKNWNSVISFQFLKSHSDRSLLILRNTWKPPPIYSSFWVAMCYQSSYCVIVLGVWSGWV